MRVLIQRVRSAEVSVAGETVSRIGVGYLLLVGFAPDDDEAILRAMAKKVAEIRICDDEDHKMNRSVRDIGGEILSVSQFTLYADARHGRRPGFTQAAPAAQADRLYEQFNGFLKAEGLPVQTGIFQTDMQVALVNDGPVTIMLDSQEVLSHGNHH